MAFVINRDDLDALIRRLGELNYEVLGPTLRDGAIVYDALSSTSDLPIGWAEVQEAGTYRLVKRADEALFGYAVGPQSWKKFLHPAERRLWKAHREGKSLEITPEPDREDKWAFIGVRSCELHAIQIQDRVFLGGGFQDEQYQKLRRNAFILVVQCGHPGGTCFCVSMGTGPKAEAGFDLALTEVLDPENHYFVIEIGSALGAEVLEQVPRREAGPEELKSAKEVVDASARKMGRSMNTEGVKELLYKNYEHSRWDQVAERCLACANCTMVCPTCFCTTVEDVTDLKGENSERWQKWDSCFTLDFSYTHGTGPLRHSVRSRYRQWLTHKLATWIDQFGSSGCVGCGRCITWCPVGIDLTQEVAAIRGQDS